jgi:hypothetical protein
VAVNTQTGTSFDSITQPSVLVYLFTCSAFDYAAPAVSAMRASHLVQHRIQRIASSVAWFETSERLRVPAITPRIVSSPGRRRVKLACSASQDACRTSPCGVRRRGLRPRARTPRNSDLEFRNSTPRDQQILSPPTVAPRNERVSGRTAAAQTRSHEERAQASYEREGSAPPTLGLEPTRGVSASCVERIDAGEEVHGPVRAHHPATQGPTASVRRSSGAEDNCQSLLDAAARRKAAHHCQAIRIARNGRSSSSKLALRARRTVNADSERVCYEAPDGHL